jgi:hypothetical protein
MTVSDLTEIDGEGGITMPLLINEMIVEIQNQVTHENDAEPLSEQVPVSPAEQELARSLALMAERRARLSVD